MVEVVQRHPPKLHTCTTCRAQLRYTYDDVEIKQLYEHRPSYTIRCPSCLAVNYVEKW